MGKVIERNMSVDIVKAFGIICMVGGHCGWPLTHFVYLFHMAIFFIASGYCYKQSNSLDQMSVIRFIKRKFVSIWFPYVLWTAIYSVLHNLFIKINFYTDNPLLMKYVSGPRIYTTEYWTILDMLKNIIKALFLRGGTQMGGAFWFLATLMKISIIYCIVDFTLNIFLRKNEQRVFASQFIISIIFLCIGFACFTTKHSLSGMDRVFSYYILFYGGYAVKKYGWSSSEKTGIVHGVVLVTSLVVLLISNRMGSISLDQNRYVNPFFLLIVSFAGWQFLYELAFLIQKVSFLNILLVCIGQNTLAVVILHFLCFKIVNYMGVFIYQQPLFLVAAFPVLYDGGVWWVAYMLVGVSIPVCLSVLWKRLENNYKNNQLQC